MKFEGKKMDNEFNNLAAWVADLMRADGITAEQVTPEIAIAYADAVGKKIAKIQSIYLTRIGAKDALTATVLATIAA